MYHAPLLVGAGQQREGLLQQLPAEVQHAHLLPAKPSKFPQLPNPFNLQVLPSSAWGRELLPPGSAI